LTTPPPEQKPRKPGFFSRLFTAKQIEEAEQKAQADLAELEQAPAPDTTEAPPGDSPYALGPEGFNMSPVVDEAPAEKKGLFSRWFGKKDKAASEEEEHPSEEPVEETPEQEEPEPAEEPGARKNWFERLRERLRGGGGSFMSAIRNAVGLSGRLDDNTVEKLEEILIAADVGMETTMKIVETMRQRAKERKTEGADAIMALFKEVVSEVFTGNVKTFKPASPQGPYVVMVVGVNGVGKTTTIGKMAKRCHDAGLKTMLVAGDTFRAAAIEQLEIWSGRTGSEFMRSKMGADPSGLVFDALSAARSRKIDVVFIDTAGRLQTKSTLMAELGKIKRVCQKVIPDSPHETLLVLDATTGQNAISQTKAFSEIVEVNGIVMTKLDGTAKGGVLLTLRDQFEIPVTLVGVGEGVDDLRDFDPEQFTAALFAEDRSAA
jgi:fused signal recognition particle receptor